MKSSEWIDLRVGVSLGSQQPDLLQEELVEHGGQPAGVADQYSIFILD